MNLLCTIHCIILARLLLYLFHNYGSLKFDFVDNNKDLTPGRHVIIWTVMRDTNVPFDYALR